MAAIQQPAALAIVVPTYNERDRLKDLVEKIASVYAGAGIDGEIVIVDDNSPDGTGALADELATRFRIKVVHRAGKLGAEPYCARSGSPPQAASSNISSGK